MCHSERSEESRSASWRSSKILYEILRRAQNDTNGDAAGWCWWRLLFFLIFVVSCFVFSFGKLLLLSKNINFTFLAF